MEDALFPSKSETFSAKCSVTFSMWAVKCTNVLLSSLVTTEMHLESQVKSTTLHGTLVLKKFSEQMFLCNRRVEKIYRIVNFGWSCEDINELRRLYCSEIVRKCSTLQYKHCKLHTSYVSGTPMMPFGKYWTI